MDMMPNGGGAMAPPYDPTMMAAPAPPPMSPFDMAWGELQMEELLAPDPPKGPTYPPWYKESDYPKPTEGAIISKARQLETQFSPLRDRIRDDLKLVRHKTFGAFPDFDRDEEFPWIDSGIEAEVELFTAQLADAELSYDAPAKIRADEDISAKKVDFLIAAREQARRIHARASNGPLSVDEARFLLLTGRIAWFCGLDFDADEDDIPLIQRLIDPTTCYPVFEAHRGMRAMVRIYGSTVGDAVGSFENEDYHLSTTYLAKTDENPNGKRREEESCEIIEYWDRRWRAVFMDGKCILGPAEHKFGFVPFIYKLGPLGLPNSIDEMVSPTSLIETTPRDVLLPDKGISLIGLLKMPHLLHEAVMGRMLTAFGREFDPPVDMEMDQMVYPDGPPESSNARGTVNSVKMGQQRRIERRVAMTGAAASPILNGAMESKARLMQPPTAHGQNNQSNVSGFASNSNIEAGRIKLVGHLKTLEEFHAEAGEMQLRLLRDWGHLLAQGYGEYGSFSIPRYDAPVNEDQSVLLTPEEIAESRSIRVRVSMSTLTFSQLGQVANALTMIGNLGIKDDIQMMRMIGDANPYKTRARIRANTIINDPDLLEAQAIQGLFEQGMEWQANYFLWKKTQQGAAPQAPPQQPAPEAGTSAMGDSLPGLGMPVGPGSGPPPAPQPSLALPPGGQF